MSLIDEVLKKKEFSGLPESVVLRALEKSGGDVKEARNFLRKYFGVFLTNRVLKGKDLLGSHFSSRKRDYQKFYSKIFEVGSEKLEVRSIPRKIGGTASPALSRGHLGGKGRRKVSVLDLGCGVNGFSYEELEKVVGKVRYVGVEAAGQLVEFMNSYFEENGLDGRAVRGDLMDLDFVEKVLKSEVFDICFLFQVVDALESIGKDFSFKLIDLVMKHVEVLVISLPLVSLGGRKRIGAEKRKWLMDWLEGRFEILDDFEMFGERILVVENRNV